MNAPLAINKILLADDDMEDCFLFKKALFQLAPGLEVSTVNDGDQIADAIASQNPDLIFLDLNLPCKSGMQCLQDLKEDNRSRNVPVVVYSTSGSQQDINLSYGFGASLYIQKPFLYTDLLETFRQVIHMNWDQPAEITNSYYINNRYWPFTLPAL